MHNIIEEWIDDGDVLIATCRQKRLEKVHKGYAYELLQLQMAVEDEHIGCQASVIEISRLIQLYMIGVEVLESVSDPRFTYFQNKIHSLMTKPHVVKKMRQAAGLTANTPNGVSKAELISKKEEYDKNCHLNQVQIDIKKVKEILIMAQTRQNQIQETIKKDIQTQETRLGERIKERKMRTQTGSIKRWSVLSDKMLFSPIINNTRKDHLVDYFQKPKQIGLNLALQLKPMRKNSASVEKKQRAIYDKKCLTKRSFAPGSGSKNQIQPQFYDQMEIDMEDAI